MPTPQPHRGMVVVDLKVVKLPTGLQSIPTLMRQIADEIDAGKYGDCASAAFVLAGDRLEVFGLGERGDAPTVCYLLQSGAVKMTLPLVNAA